MSNTENAESREWNFLILYYSLNVTLLHNLLSEQNKRISRWQFVVQLRYTGLGWDLIRKARTE